MWMHPFCGTGLPFGMFDITTYAKATDQSAQMAMPLLNGEHSTFQKVVSGVDDDDGASCDLQEKTCPIAAIGMTSSVVASTAHICSGRAILYRLHQIVNKFLSS